MKRLLTSLGIAEHKWHFAGVLMMAQHCWLSSFLIFKGILISIAKKPYISYDFSEGEGPEPLSPPSGSAHEYAQLMLDPHHKFLSTTFRASMLLPSHHRSMRLAGVRQWSDFVCLFGLQLLDAQKKRLTVVNNSACLHVI